MSVKKLLVVSSLLCATFGHASQTTSFSREEINGLFNTPSVEVASLSEAQLKGTEGGDFWSFLGAFFAFTAAPMQTVQAVQMPNIGQTLRQVSNACSGPLCQVTASSIGGGLAGAAIQLAQPVVVGSNVAVGLAAGCAAGAFNSGCINPTNRNALFFGPTPTPVTVITPPITGAVTGSGSSSSSAVATVIGAPTQQSMSPPPRRLTMVSRYSPASVGFAQRFRGR